MGYQLQVVKPSLGLPAFWHLVQWTPPEVREVHCMICEMELTVRSLQGSYIVSGLDRDATVADVKQLLHKQHRQQVPEPEEQRLVGVHSASSALKQPQREAVN